MSERGEFWARWRVRLGYALALVYVWLAAPTVTSIEVGAVYVAAGLLLRGFSAGHLRKQESLATTGPYDWTRNPLYLGSAVLACGFLVAGRSIVAAFLVAAYFLLIYPPVMRREERELRARFGAAFDDYAARVPLFLPRPAAVKQDGNGFQWKSYMRNREFNATIGSAVGFVLLWLKMMLIAAP